MLLHAQPATAPLGGIPESVLAHRNVGPEAVPIFAAVPRHVVLRVLYECMGRGNHTLIGMVMSDTHDFLLIQARLISSHAPIDHDRILS